MTHNAQKDQFRFAKALILGGCSDNGSVIAATAQVFQFQCRKEFPLKDKDSGPNHHLKVHVFLVLESVPGSKDLLISVLLQADGQFLGKTSLGTVAEGQEILLSLSWDKPKQSFVVSSETAGTVPILSFIPFTSPGAARDALPTDFSVTKSFVVSSDVSGNAEAHENQK